ncbi:MAG: Asp23/Gls24 family envelope stress response protein, partial [Puniceicoccales bacterium]|nr:Asp23/Gls24 family envelope stress response protein [Puniceicoccales bacterium]
GASITSRLSKFFGKDRSCSGIRVSEDAHGNYIIDVQVVLRFGVELAKVALDIQQNVTQKVSAMTMKSVGQVNVTIEKVVQSTDTDSGQPNVDYAVN